MENLITAVIFLLIVASIWAFTTWRKLKNMEELKEWVAWSVCDSDNVRYNIPLWAHLKNAQIHANIRDKYRITGKDEWESAKAIISNYQNNLTQLYFDDKLWVLKGNSKYALKGEDYFIFMLYVYLCEHELQDNNVVFHKMQYITYMHCKQHIGLQNNVSSWNEDRLEKMLDDDLTKKSAEEQNPFLGDVTYDMVMKLTYDIGVSFVTAQRLINAERKEAGLPPIYYEERPAPISEEANLKINWRD